MVTYSPDTPRKKFDSELFAEWMSHQLNKQASVPARIVAGLVRNPSAAKTITRTGKYFSVPGLQEYLTRAQYTRMMRRVAAIRREMASSGASPEAILAGRDMGVQRAAKAARREAGSVRGNLSSLERNGFGRVGTTYSGYDIYDMPFSEEARTALRRVVDEQYGVRKNPWCIIQRDGLPNGRNLGMSEASRANWISEMERPASGRFRVGVDPRTGRLFAIETTQTGSLEYPAWQSLSNHAAINLSDAASLRSTDAATFGTNRHKVLLGYEKGPDGVLYPRFNKGSRMSGDRLPVRSWRASDAIDEGVEVL